MTADLDQRVPATEETIARYDKPFDWAGANCIRLARAQAIALGHEVPPVPLFRTALGAQRALAKRGFASVSEMLDHYFTRWPAPAFALAGDLVAGPASEEHGLEAIGIADGSGKVIGWFEGRSHLGLTTILQSGANLSAAWRL